MKVWTWMGVLLLACGLGGLPAPCAAADPQPSILAVARDDLPDPSFRDAVVLVMNNLGPAPAGLIVNRPTRVAVSKLFPDDPKLAQVEDKLYFGGPVDVRSVSFVFRAAAAPENAVEVLPGVFISRDRDLLRTLLARERPMDGLRIFLGYAGWGPGQLENEVGRGDWTLAPADASAIFSPKSEHPWPDDAEPAGAQRI
jgi:putative transcriptional regulator